MNRIIAAFLCITVFSTAFCADGTWEADANGRWDDPLNWLDAIIGGGADANVTFTGSTADRTVTIPAGGVTARRLYFNASGNNNWTFTGGPFAFEGTPARVAARRGTHRFEVPVNAPDGLQREADGGGTLCFARSFTSAGKVELFDSRLSVQPRPTLAETAAPLLIDGLFTVSALHLPSGSSEFIPSAGAAASVSTWTLAQGSASVTGGATSGIVPGQRVSGPGVPEGAFVRRIVDSVSFELSAPATAAGEEELTFAAYAPATVARIGTINTANNHKNVAAEVYVGGSALGSMTVIADKVEGGDNLRKTGPGTLQLADLSAMASSVRLDAGTLIIDNPATVPDAPADAPALHMDASAAHTLTLAPDNTVTEWRDVNGSNTAFVVAGVMNAPAILPDALNGMPAVDFGVFGLNGSSLGWASAITNIQAIFMVLGSQEKGGFLLGSYNNAELDNVYDFHRGGPDGFPQGERLSDAISSPHVGCSGFRSASLWSDGQKLAIQQDGFNGGYQLLEVIMTGPGRANAFCFDRVPTRNRAGGQRICEVILYTRAITEVERIQTQAYLACKWFNTTFRPASGSSEMHQVVAKASDVELQVTPGTRLTIDSAPGGRQVTFGGGGTVELKNGARSGARLLLRHGAVELPAAAGVPGPVQSPVSNAFFHLDASAEGTVITDSAGGVLEWRDVNHAENGLAAAPPAGASLPVLAPAALNGLPLIDLGAVNSGRCMLWNHTNTNIRAVFIVYGTLEERLEAFLLGDASPTPHGGNPHFHRGADGTVWYNGAHGSFRSAPVFVNGRIVDNGEQFVLPETPTVLSTVAADNSGTPTASALGVDRWGNSGLANRTGGSTLAEVIIYTNRLTYAQRRDVEAYLMQKWLNQPAPGRTLTGGVRDGLATLDVQATNTAAVSVTGSGTVRVTDIAGAGDVEKRGSGTLLIGSAQGLNGSLRVKEGALRFDAAHPLPTPETLPGGLAFRFDASSAAVQTVLGEGGETLVTRVDDADGRAFHAAADTDAARPALLPAALNGLPVVDFGAYGSGRRLLWSDLVSNIRSVFWVVGSPNGSGGFLLGCDDRFGENDDYANFHRGDPFSLAIGRLWRHNASTYVKEGVNRLNGIPVDGMTTPLGEGFDILTVVTTGDTRASAFATDRHFSERSGGPMLAEVLVFTRALSAQEVRDVEAYLSAKWFGASPAGYASAAPAVAAAGTDGGAIEVDASGLRAGGVQDEADLLKQGAGTLFLSGLASVTGRIDVAEGGLAVGGAVLDAPPVIDTLIYHIDPSRPETLLFDAVDGSVTSILSRVGSNVARRWAYQSDFRGPELLADALNGLPVLDFGAFGSKRFLELDQHVEGVRSIFMVFGSQAGGGWLLGDQIGNNDHRNFHRGNPGWNIPSTPMFNNYDDSKHVHTEGSVRQDGVIVAPLSTGFNGGYQIIEIHTSRSAHFQVHAADRTRDATATTPGDMNRTGGQRLGEVLAYSRLLADHERQQVYDYLAAKWMGVPHPDIRRAGDATAAAITVRQDTWLDLAGTVASTAELAGSGAISNGTVTVTSLIAPGDASGAVGTLSVEGITVADNARYEADWIAAANDTVIASGVVTFLGSGTVDIRRHDNSSARDIVLFRFDQLVGAEHLAEWRVISDLPGNYTAKLTVVGNTVRAVFLPEGTLLLLK